MPYDYVKKKLLLTEMFPSAFTVSALSNVIKDIHLKLCLLSYLFKNQYALKIISLVST